MRALEAPQHHNIVECRTRQLFRSYVPESSPGGSESTTRLRDCRRMGLAVRIAQTGPNAPHDTRLYDFDQTSSRPNAHRQQV
jgi:hypothetical protein